MLDWIFEGIANWVASVMTQIMDAISGVFLDALGTDMTAMEEYFPFAVSAYTVIQCRNIRQLDIFCCYKPERCWGHLLLWPCSTMNGWTAAAIWGCKMLKFTLMQK